jgi:FMN-dependent NADH-azoreductase
LTKLLHVAVSARGAASFSRRAAEALIQSLRRSDPNLAVSVRDLGADPPPHPDCDFVEPSLSSADMRDEAAQAALALSEVFIAELEASDLIVLSTPMHNFTAPSALKAWLDHVVRPERAFRRTPFGKVGLLSDRPVLAVIACGGRFGETPGAQSDFLSPYLRYVFGVIGLTRFEALRLDELGRGDEKIALGFRAAERWIGAQSARYADRRL